MMNDSPVVLTDETGRTLPCEIENIFQFEGIEYLLLEPVDAAVQIFAWRSIEDGEDADEQELSDIDDSELDIIFPIAKAVLAEQNLILKRTGFTLTVEGELPEIEEDQLIELDDETGEGGEELQELAQFYHEDQAYSIFAPLDPLLMFGKRNSQGKVELLSPEELEKLQPYIQEELLAFEDDEEE
jgi:hypothetical protein